MPKAFIVHHTNLYFDSDSPYTPISDEQPKAPGEAAKVQKAIQDSRDMYTLPQAKGKGKKEVGVDSSDGVAEGGGVVASTVESTPRTIRINGQLYRLALQKMLPSTDVPVETRPQELTVAYLWVVDAVSNEKIQLYMQILQPDGNVVDVMEEMADFADAEWDDNYSIGKTGVAKPADILKGEELQDALDQLGRSGHAEINTSTPRGRQIPKRVLVPSKAEVVPDTIRVKGQLYRLAEVTDVAGPHDRIEELRELRQSWDDGDIDADEYMEKLRKLEEKPKKEASTAPTVIRVKDQLYRLEN